MTTNSYHLTDGGLLRPCHATKRVCRYGGERHYPTLQAGQQALEDEGEKKLLPPVMRKRKPLPPPQTVATVQEATSLLEALGTPQSYEEEFVQQALRDYKGYSEGGYEARCFALTDEKGRPTAAATLLFHEEEDEYLGPQRYYLLTYLGSTGGGQGRRLAEECKTFCQREKITLYLEPTATSSAFWRKMGVVHDPQGDGIFYHGFSEAVFPSA